jgi:putative phosphoribosyl transferase
VGLRSTPRLSRLRAPDTPRRSHAVRAAVMGNENRIFVRSPHNGLIVRFKDRADAGRVLSERLSVYAGRSDVIVLGLPRGGLPVAAEVASALDVSLDLFLVRKLGVPGQPELAMGAIAEGGIEILRDALISELHIAPEQVRRIAERERAELERQEVQYRAGRARPVLAGLIVILVDDGLATGSTMQAAVAALRHLDPARIIVAAPVAAPETVARLASCADEVVAVLTPQHFRAVGLWYRTFEQTTDAEVQMLLTRRRREPGAEPPGTPSGNDKL